MEAAAAKHYAQGAAKEEVASKNQKVSKEDILSHYNPKSPYKVPTYYSTKDDALKAFLRRKDPNGMNLSKRVWNLTPEYRVAIEDAISVALKKGQGPVALSHKVVRYLRDYDKLNADYKRRFGTARKAKDCHYAAYRLAYTEINMAYRVAEQERWRTIDDIVGYEVKTRESSHKDVDVCDILQGKYPKTFKWVGWHPMCHCYAVPIFRSDDETAQGSKAAVRDVPGNFKEWVKSHAEGVERARGRGTLPYFLKDNAATWGEAAREARYDREVELILGVLRGANASLPVGKKGVGAITGRSETKHKRTDAREDAYANYSDDEWVKGGLFKNGGYLVTQKARLEQAVKSKNEMAKFQKEQEMCLTAAKNGHAVEHLADAKDGGTYDAVIDGVKTDLKRTEGAGNIQKYGIHAVRKQGAEQVYFQFDNWTTKHRTSIGVLSSLGIHGVYILSEAPSIEHHF